MEIEDFNKLSENIKKEFFDILNNDTSNYDNSRWYLKEHLNNVSLYDANKFIKNHVIQKDGLKVLKDL